MTLYSSSRLLALGLCLPTALTALLGGARQLSDVFDCPPLPPHLPAEDVRALRPSDISIIMGYGDSNMAGYGMKGIKNANRGERRGQAAAIGGDVEAITLPNFLSFYNPNLAGAAKGTTSIGCQCHCKNATLCPEPRSSLSPLSPLQAPLSLPFTPDSSDVSGLFNDCNEELCNGNGAISGAIAVVHEIMPGATLERAPDHLISLINNKTTFPSINFETDWKLITVFVGAIDNLMACKADPPIPLQNFTQTWNNTLAQMYEKFPRTVVQVVSEMELLRTVFNTSTDDYCLQQYDKLAQILDCCTHPGNGTNCDKVQKLAENWNIELEKLVQEWEAKKFKEFRVILNPFIKRNPILSGEVSAYDCFHPNLVNNQNSAINMWNNLFLPYQSKHTVINRTAVPYCPQLNDFIQ